MSDSERCTARRYAGCPAVVTQCRGRSDRLLNGNEDSSQGGK